MGQAYEIYRMFECNYCFFFIDMPRTGDIMGYCRYSGLRVKKFDVEMPECPNWVGGMYGEEI